MSHGMKSANGKSAKVAPEPSREMAEKPPPAPASPPDGGWGWMVVFAAFLIHIIIDGMTYSFGIFFDEFLRYFKESNSKTSWIASLLTGFTLCSGPLVSWSMNRWGCKLVAIGGALLAFTCMSLSALAGNVLTLIFTVGVGTGLGCGFMYLPAIVSVSIWFERRRSLATGIAVCGAGLGMFIFPPMTKSLIEALDWRRAMAIIGALNLIGVPLGLTLRPVPRTPVSELMLPEEKKSSLKRSQSTEHMALANGNIEEGDAKLILSETDLNEPHNQIQLPNARSGIMNTPDVDDGSMASLTKFQASSATLERTQLTTKEEKPTCGCLPCSAEYKSSIVKMFDLSLLVDPIYLLFCLSNFVTNIGYYIPIFYTQNMTKGLGIKNPEYLMSIIGVGSLLGRTSLGYISDKPWVNRLVVYNMCLVIAGISTAWAGACTEFWGLAVFAVTFGFTSGAYVALTPVVLVDLVGVDKVSNALGMVLLVLGTSSLIGPPILGGVYDATNSYPLVYYLAGGLIFLSGLIPFMIPLLRRRRAARARMEQELSLGLEHI